MNTRTAARELAFLALSHIANSDYSNPQELILSATRTLKDYSKQRIRSVQKDLQRIGEYFFHQELNKEEQKIDNPSAIDIKNLHNNVCKLEEAAFALRESLDLPELFNHTDVAYKYSSELVGYFKKNKELVNEHIANALEKRKTISDSEKGWTPERVLSVDRNVLKIIVTEMLMNSEIPRVVLIDEAVKLSEKYGSEESPKFVNGVLADISKAI
ncbi:MAG TPA: transcription antitermination protein NusB [Vampirovibrionales bacterium]